MRDGSNTLAIDFGSARTKVARYNEHQRRAEVVSLGKDVRSSVPSVFYIPQERTRECLVGDEAMARLGKDPAGIVYDLKREIHRTGKKRLGSGRTAWARVDLLSELFRWIRNECASKVLFTDCESVTSCSLTVPAASIEEQRQAFREAAARAGFTSIKLREEPEAAARAWLRETRDAIADHILVCDIGGGTTDFALLRYCDHRISDESLVPPTGFHRGGNDIDHAVFDWLDEQGLILGEETSTDAWILAVRKAREASDSEESIIRATCGGHEVEIPLRVVDEAIESYLSELDRELTVFVERAATLAKVENPMVLLAGGGVHLPGLHARLSTRLGCEPDRIKVWNDSEFAVVLGAVDIPDENLKIETDIEQIILRDRYERALRSAVDGSRTNSVGALRDLRSLRDDQLGLDGGVASKVEKEIIGGTLDEHIEARSSEALADYEALARRVWQDQMITEQELAELETAIHRSGLSDGEVTSIEREIFGASRDLVFKTLAADQQKVLKELRAAYWAAASAKSGEAAAIIDRALACDPNDVEFLLLKSKQCYHLGDFATSEAFANRAIVAGADSEDAWCRRAMGRFRQGTETKIKQAADDAQYALENTTLEWVNQPWIGVILTRAGRIEQAVSVFDSLYMAFENESFNTDEVPQSIHADYEDVNDMIIVVMYVYARVLVENECAGSTRFARAREVVCSALEHLVQRSKDATPAQQDATWVKILQLAGLQHDEHKSQAPMEALQLLLIAILQRHHAASAGGIPEVISDEVLDMFADDMVRVGVGPVERILELYPEVMLAFAIAMIGMSSVYTAEWVTASLRCGTPHAKVVDRIRVALQQAECAQELRKSIWKVVTPVIVVNEQHGALLNAVTVNNQSPYPVHNVQVSIIVRHETRGIHEMRLDWPVVDAYSTATKENAFIDPGVFGRKIRRIDIASLTCDELQRMQSVEQDGSSPGRADVVAEA
jgi:actin-like ATPase involved in cell morphogenesis/tetratricopeptide (TPR) repeat protein